MSVSELLENAQTSAKRAVEFDQSGQFSVASYYYQDAARSLHHAVKMLDDEDTATAWQEKISEYENRSLEIEKQDTDSHTVATARQPVQQSEDMRQLQSCNFLFSQALDADEAGLTAEALELYTQAVEHSIKAKKASTDLEIQQKLGSLALQALDRAETLKGIGPPSPVLATPSAPSSPIPNVSSHAAFHQNVSGEINSTPGPSTVNSPERRPALHRGCSAHLKIVGGSDSYTEDEKRVLLATSRINDIDYVPFMSIDLREKFQYAIPFTDKDKPLALSPKQRREFDRWARPQEFCTDPKLIVGSHVDPYGIKQSIISDCSFVASLAVSALYERRFGRRLITSIIYPRNRNKEPVYNPFGKYMIKLHLNGVPRKVIVDDTLPMGRHGQLLCSYSTNPNELWISLLEKAYMKVMGGYDFPGSNSNIDLHALTGWIPERFGTRAKEADYNADSLFDLLMTRMAKGDVLVTVATGDLSEREADRAGLVPTHAYAVLDAREVNGVRLMKLKNPWSHLRWRGNYSELDKVHWTPQMQEALKFDPNSAAMFDNGVFWIDYESVIRFFDVFYLNWNPQMFQFTYCIHQSWRAGVGPIKDAYNIGENPQFRLEVGPGSGAVWILLTRHITDIEDFKENQEYICVLVYSTGGKRVYYPYDPPPHIDGVRINSPHYLCKLKLSEGSPRKYTLVVSQYEKMNTIFYTLRAYATCPFKLEPIKNLYVHKKQVSDGQWKGRTAGGCSNNPTTYPNNPCFQLVLESPHNNNHILIDLKGPKQYQIGVDIRAVVLNDSSATFQRTNSGTWRSGFMALEVDDMPAGSYEIIPSTFHSGQEGPFILSVKSSCPLKLSRLQ